jgi:hypothetical protein
MRLGCTDEQLQQPGILALPVPILSPNCILHPCCCTSTLQHPHRTERPFHSLLLLLPACESHGSRACSLSNAIMPFPALLRRNRKSDVHIRRHSVIVEPSETAAYIDAPPLPLHSPLGRLSDLDQRPHLDASAPTTLSAAGEPRGEDHDDDDDALLPPSLPGRPRPLSGLVRFRHASDSQLSTSARSSRVTTADGLDPAPAPAPQPADMPPSKLHAARLRPACFALLIRPLLPPSSACYHNHCTDLRHVRASVHHPLSPLQVARLL